MTDVATRSVKLTKVLPNGEFLFCREGVYFSLNRQDITDIHKLVAESSLIWDGRPVEYSPIKSGCDWCD